MLYNFIDCVVIGDVDEDGADDKEKSAQLANEQNVVAKVAHLIKAPEDDYEHQLEMLNVAYDALLRGGARRIRYTFPSLVFAGIACGRDIVLAERAEKPDAHADSGDENGVPADTTKEDKEQVMISFTMPMEVKSPWLKNLCTLSTKPSPR